MPKSKNKAVQLYLGIHQRQLLIGVMVHNQQPIQFHTSPANRLSENLLITIKGVLQQHNLNWHDLEHIYLSHGPGHFNGIRLLVLLVKTIATWHNISVSCISNLQLHLLCTNQTQVATLANRTDGFYASLVHGHFQEQLVHDIHNHELIQWLDPNYDDPKIIQSNLHYFWEHFQNVAVQDLTPNYLWHPYQKIKDQIGD